jgi:hypothetical protein
MQEEILDASHFFLHKPLFVKLNKKHVSRMGDCEDQDQLGN